MNVRFGGGRVLLFQSSLARSSKRGGCDKDRLRAESDDRRRNERIKRSGSEER